MASDEVGLVASFELSWGRDMHLMVVGFLRNNLGVVVSGVVAVKTDEVAMEVKWLVMVYDFMLWWFGWKEGGGVL